MKVWGTTRREQRENITILWSGALYEFVWYELDENIF